MKTLIAALVAAAALPALAQSATPRIDSRQSNQDARIQQGVQSGSLTNKEATKLEAGQAKVQRMENRAKADGKVTGKERAAITKQQNKQSRKIAKEKHDKQKKAPAS